MSAPLEPERRAAASRAQVFVGGVCALIGLIVFASYEHAPVSKRAPALAFYVPPVAVPGQQTMPAAPPSVMTPPNTPGARIPAAPAAPVASPSVIVPMESPGTQMPAAPAAPVYMMPAPVGIPETQTGPQMFSGFFAGLASSFAIAFIILAKRIYDSMNGGVSVNGETQDTLELGMLPGRAGIPTMMADEAVDSDGQPGSLTKQTLVDAIALKAGVSKKTASLVLGATLDVIVDSVCAGKKVSLTGFGTFTSKERAQREGRNPQSQEKIILEAATVPAFSFGKTFKDAVKAAGKLKDAA